MNSPNTVGELDAKIRALQAQREAGLVSSEEAHLETVKRLYKLSRPGFRAISNQLEYEML